MVSQSVKKLLALGQVSYKKTFVTMVVLSILQFSIDIFLGLEFKDEKGFM
jgi:hypothetical protein